MIADESNLASALRRALEASGAVDSGASGSQEVERMLRLLGSALRHLTTGCPTWIVADGRIRWSNDEGAAAAPAAAESIVEAASSADGLEVIPLGAAADRLVRRRVQEPLARRLAVATSRWALTPGQARVLEPVVRGLSNKETAALLGVEEATVEAHLGAMFRKSGTAGRAAMLFGFWTTTEP
jgi:DNA-binding CsgD family transcriptional regulator